MPKLDGRRHGASCIIDWIPQYVPYSLLCYPIISETLTQKSYSLEYVRLPRIGQVIYNLEKN